MPGWGWGGGLGEGGGGGGGVVGWWGVKEFGIVALSSLTRLS